MDSPNILDAVEGPLSPILGSSSKSVNRRRKLKDKSRVKLSDKFDTTEQNPEYDQKKKETEGSYCLMQEINVWDEIDKIEEATAQKKEPILQNFSFKIPLSPAPLTRRRSSQASPHRICIINTVSSLEPQTKKDIGFQTCSGKKIEAGQNSKVFDDILYSSKNNDNKIKKFNFLKKSEPGDINLRYKQEANVSSVTELCKETDEDFTFSQEIDDLGISNTQLITAMDTVLDEHKKKINIQQNKEQFRGFTMVEKEEFQSYTCNFLKMHQKLINSLNNFIKKNDKKGTKRTNKCFIKEEQSIKKRKLDKGNTENHFKLDNVKGCTLNNNKTVKDNLFKSNFIDSFQESFSGFSKASGVNISKKAWSKSKQIFENTEEKISDSNNSNIFQGFSKASGSLISISNTSLLKAKNLFINVKKEILNSKTFSEISQVNFSKSCLNNVSSFSETNISKEAEATIKDFSNKENIDLQGFLKPNNLFANLDDDLDNTVIKKDCSNKEYTDFEGFSKASDSSISISKKANNLFANLDNDLDNTVTTKHFYNKENIDFQGFSKASGSSIILSKTALQKANNIFANLDDDLENTEVAFKTPKKYAMKHKEDVQNFSLEYSGFSNASGKNISISNEAWSKSKKIFENIDGEEFYQTNKSDANFDKFSKASSSTVSDNTLLQDLHLSTTNEYSKGTYFSRSLSESSLDSTVIEFKTPKRINALNSTNLSSGKRKRSLGVTPCKQIDVPEQKLTKARLMFDDQPKKSPIKQSNPPVSNRIISSTPLHVGKPSSSVVSDKIMKAKSIFGDEDFSDIFGEKNITVINKNNSAVFNSTPIKSQIMHFKPNISKITNVSVNSEQLSATEENVTVINNHGIVLKEPDKLNIEVWEKNLQTEKERLESALKNVIKKQNALAKLKVEKETSKRRQFGTISVAKKGVHCVSLKNFVMSKKPGTEANFNEDYKLFDINPQNAASVHFKSKNIIKTIDGAILIPNSNDQIGLSEIEIAFLAMPGVDPKLTPKNWIKNHYKWIIWKLASYRRMFPGHFQDVLCLEQVIQQLKYRYDREIDRAERSALRKIYEKDDVSQKRLVLCVSNITEDKGKYELELTDGWYAIKTVIDDPLSFQVFKRKIQIGTKLITSGADVYNCDGCYPLETTNMVYMKINFNCTRRAAWYSKLGYQTSSSPFPIQLSSIHQSGGVIGCVKVYIARTYPLKYMERENAAIVWRNKKAEERRAQEWEMERNKKIEQIQEAVQKEFTVKSNNENRVRYCKKDISEVTCPISLNEIYESSIDPDSVQELLSSSQRKILMDYQRNQAREKQDKINAKVRDLVTKSNLSKRDVSSIWRLLIVDVNSNLEQAYSLNIWRPTHSHQQILKEGKVVTVYNVLPGRCGELSSTFKTKFNLNPEVGLAVYNSLNRKLVPISFLLNEAPIFNEFDTVGIIVDIKFDFTFQSIWLADDNNVLLLVKIREPAKYCILLDNLKRGQIISCCNLCYQKPESGVAQASANHYSVFSRYTQYKHLQESVNALEKKVAGRVDNYLTECDTKIKNFIPNNSNVSDDSKDFEESTLDLSRVTDTDLAMSMIDIDELLKQ